MNKNRIAGAGKQIKGTIKEAVGKLVGNTRLRLGGKTDRVVGKVQNLVGVLKDSMKP